MRYGSLQKEKERKTPRKLDQSDMGQGLKR